MRIAIIGGTFNPVHKGHLMLADEALRKLELDKVIFMPTKLTPLRQQADIIDAEDRYNMLKIAVSGRSYLEVSRLEIDKGGLSYTVDTLEAFKNSHPADELFFIAGADVLGELDKWKDFDKICQLATFVIAKRPDYKLPREDKRFLILDVATPDISSSMIREKAAGDETIEEYLPAGVFEYVRSHNLYGD